MKHTITGWSLSRYSKGNWNIFLHFTNNKGVKCISGNSLFQVLKGLIKYLIRGK